MLKDTQPQPFGPPATRTGPLTPAAIGAMALELSAEGGPRSVTRAVAFELRSQPLRDRVESMNELRRVFARGQSTVSAGAVSRDLMALALAEVEIQGAR